MRKLLKPLSLAMTALMLIASLTACAKTPTPAEIYEKVEGAGNGKVVMKIKVGELMTTKSVMKMDGDKAHIVTEVEMMGAVNEEETYEVKKGDKRIVYSKDKDGNWTKEEKDEEEDEDGVEAFMELFDTDNYEEFDKESRRYVMKEDVELEIGEMVCSEGYIEVGEDGTYVIYTELEMGGMGAKIEGSLKITISEIGEISVKLPKVD